jgi:tetrahydromethanopterin S-methyltransferase subunit C
MSSKHMAVFGIYATPGTAEAAVDHLLAKGFTNAAISVLLPDDESTRAFAHEKHTKAPEGTTAGVTTGGLVGGTLGLLAGIGALAIPGVGPLIAAGPIMATLAGVGVGGAVGGIVGALVGMGIPEFEAKRYEGAVKEGGTLLSVHCDTSEEIDVAKTALKETGAHDISSASEAGSEDKVGARGTFGNISDGETLAERDEVVTPGHTSSTKY